jgi:hypothetical protein
MKNYFENEEKEAVCLSMLKMKKRYQFACDCCKTTGNPYIFLAVQQTPP